ncbi:MAG: hypothetical protein ACTTIC_03885 [Helicobacteraceae bacterium]
MRIKYFILILVWAAFVSCQSDTLVKKGNTAKLPLEFDPKTTKDAHCRMTIGSLKYSAQVISPEGLTWFFHDPGSVVKFLEGKDFEKDAVIWFYTLDTQEWARERDVFFSQNEPTPMQYGFGAHKNNRAGFISYAQMRQKVLSAPAPKHDMKHGMGHSGHAHDMKHENSESQDAMAPHGGHSSKSPCAHHESHDAKPCEHHMHAPNMAKKEHEMPCEHMQHKMNGGADPKADLGADLKAAPKPAALNAQENPEHKMQDSHHSKAHGNIQGSAQDCANSGKQMNAQGKDHAGAHNEDHTSTHGAANGVENTAAQGAAQANPQTDKSNAASRLAQMQTQSQTPKPAKPHEHAAHKDHKGGTQ